MKTFKGFLHADGYAGFNALFDGDVVEVACWAHVRRKSFDVHAAIGSPIAKEALDRIGALYGTAKPRFAAGRQASDSRHTPATSWPADRRVAVLARRHQIEALSQDRTRRPPCAMPSHAGLPCDAYLDDGRLEIDNNAARRALRGVALGRKNYLFAGSDEGGRRATAAYSLIETAKLNGIDPEAYLRDVLARIADHPINRVAKISALELEHSLQDLQAA